ncbi:tetratricopeptide repeat-containing sensor histidine kinase [Sphingobacterium paramultivorum]|uniref:histidine kinase n=1 Tax=Sphingobacterium paramultivorum TaxID=2886510 RepID=A0A7G5E6U2_9SPHI|nr:ATP-binding protein [Sphingobacterium paramultivorum]QMV69717.1 tetratricopeptide repeat-containing sensor histidine kinase [Sphingobacterium paramultivorum]WSO13534.1 tetratricopeptide repeat-containing sensor histidine kinase [Sphingobacterium paramultivorum]
MGRLSILFIVTLTVLFIFPAHGQNSGWDKLDKQLAEASSDSTRILAYYKVASEIYRSNPQEAQEIVSKGLNLISEKKFEPLQIDLLNLQGVIYLKLNNFDESVKTHFKVLKKREERNDKKGVMLSYLNIGNVFNKSYDPDQALKYYQRALDLAKELRDTRNRANISTNIGNIYAQNALNGEKKQDVAHAIDYLVKTVEFCKANAPEVDLFNTYILLSYLYLKADKLEWSTYYTDLAIDITAKKKDPVGESYARINRANIYVKEKRFDLAAKEVALIKSVIAESGFTNLTEDLQGDFDKIAKAIKEQDAHLILSDQDSSDRKFHEDAEVLRVRIREELREKYESEKKELENKNLLLKNVSVEREAHWVKLMWLTTFFILLIISIMVLLLIRKNRLLREEKRKVDQQATEIRHQHEELLHADRFRSSIFSVVSHDLRSPIATFQTLLSVAKIVDLPANEIKEMLLNIGYQVEVASKMLDDLLVWSSQQMADDKLEIQTVYPLHVIEECQQLFADRIHLKKLNVTIDISAELAIKTDLKRFEFIIRNIFNNAIKFSLSGKSVVIGQQENPQSIIISIRDEGLGMDAATIRSLQDKGFQKSFEGTFHEKGTGIGLLLCHEFAKRINCTISIESTIGFGSTFYIQISKNS